jgi:uncharacterized protein
MKFIFSFLFLFGLSAGAANDDFVPPSYSQPVMDNAGMLDSAVVQKLSRALETIYQKGGPQVGVLTVNTIGDMVVEDASMKVAKAWKLGTEKKDNGILLLIAKKERKIRIEVGQGVEGDLTDAYSRRIIDDVMVPLFKQGQFTDAVALGLDGILKRMDPPIHLAEYIELREPPAANDGAPISGLIRLAIIFFGGGGGGFSGGGGGGFSGGGASGSW